MNSILYIPKDILAYFYQKTEYLLRKYRLYYHKNSVINSSGVSKDTELGNYVYIGYNTIITRAKIGNYCSIASNVSIGMGEHDLNKISTNSIFYENQYRELTKKDCTIGNDVWIGVDAIIRRGVRIGNGAVIGANSFVNMDIPPYAIAAGSPAKILRYRFTESQIEEIEQSHWWELDRQKAKEVMDILIKKIHA